MKKRMKILIPVLAVLALVISAFALALPAMAEEPPGANSNAIGIGIMVPPGTYYYGDTIYYTVYVSVPVAIPALNFYPAQQTDIDTYLILPSGDVIPLGTIPALNPGQTHMFDAEPYVVDPLDVTQVSLTDVVVAEAECFGTAQLNPPVPSSATAEIATPVVYEELDVSKTVFTYYERTHEWDIDKWVETENGELWNDTDIPKIWLYEGGSGDETATWYVCVTYMDSYHHDHNVSGEITIENTGTAPAVIVSVEDVLGGIPIDVEWPMGWGPGSTLPVGDTLVLTYNEDGLFEGLNVVTVITEVDEYTAQADIVWGEPNVEHDKVVTIMDDSEFLADPLLGELDADDFDPGDVVCFYYYEFFAWTDYDAPGPYVYDNTATIIETGQSADARLVVNWLYEDLTVEKTAIGRYLRTHEWDIDKWVETENGELWNDTDIPKIWLYEGGSGDETATWNVCVTYEGYRDSDFNVSGTITITNTGTQDAVITGVQDILCDELIDIEWPPGTEFPYLLEVGESLVGTYSEDVDEKVDCDNYVNVFTEVDEYGASESIVWGDPDEEYLDVVNVEDDSDLFGNVWLGMLDAADLDEGDVVCFDYDEFFAWADYDAPGPYVYDNTATIIETGQSADARLVVNWEYEEVCWADETAWAYGDDFANPNWDYVNNKFWGWTNGPLGVGNYTWDIYAGAGQNDLSKGTVVGTLYVSYDGDCVWVLYEADHGYYIGETHLWVGNDVLPSVTRGKKAPEYTNAPGQFPYGTDYGFDPADPDTWETEWSWSQCGFEGDIYVAAHAVVWMEVECEDNFVV